jgi:hypothetical protein
MKNDDLSRSGIFKKTGIRGYLLRTFPAVVPAPLAAVGTVGLLDDIGVMALLADRAVAFHLRLGLGLFFHGE